MEAKELRIGNLVQMDNQIVEITGILKRGFYFGEHGYAANILDWFTPIQLTEEWLIKFGLAKNNGYPYKFLYGYIKIRNGIFFFKYFSFEIQLKYVHQLQNLYFALTSEELIIK